jgi:hypothetical protein
MQRTAVNLFAVLLAGALAATSHAKVFYVDPSTVTGQVLAKAAGTTAVSCQTIQAAADQAQAGDRILLADGDYTENAIIAASGTPQNKLVISAANFKQAVIHGTLVIKGDNVRIEGLVIDGKAPAVAGLAKAAGAQSAAGALELQGTAADVIGATFQDVTGLALGCTRGARVANCHFLRCNQNVSTNRNCVLENNDFEDMRGTNTDNMRVIGSNTIIRNSYIHGTRFANTGASHVDCFQSYDNNNDTTHNILLEGNWCFGDYHQGIMLENDQYDSDHIRDWHVRNNIFCNFAAICITACKGSGIPGMNVYNNLFINSAGNTYAVQFNGPRGTGIVKNNIFFFIRSNSLVCLNGATMDAGKNQLNLSVGHRGVTSVGDQLGDPKFTVAANQLTSEFSGNVWTRYFDKTNFNIDLTAASPCINTGIDLSGINCPLDPAFDHDIRGKARPQHGAFDIGPFEYDGALSIADVVPGGLQGRVTVDNPCRGRAMFRLSGAAAVGNVDLKIYDQRGNPVRRVIDISDKTMTWDGCDGAGKPARPGVYQYEMAGSHGTYCGSLILIK